MRLGIDFGGTKIEAAVLDASGEVVARQRRANPGDYQGAINTVLALVEAMQVQTRKTFWHVGLGTPGSRSPRTGLMRNSNSVYLNGRPFLADLEAALGRPVRMANDANCFALSEAADGAGAGARTVFGAILGTGCGGGVVVDGKIVDGPNGIGGEWGHVPLPWLTDEERAQRHRCWCGLSDCLETWIAGSAFVAGYGEQGVDGAAIIARARAGEAKASAALDRYIDRLGRALAMVCTLIDPDVIVLGGGMSNTAELYERLPAAAAPHVFSDVFATPIRQAEHGDSSGVRGAAWLWPER